MLSVRNFVLPLRLDSTPVPPLLAIVICFACPAIAAADSISFGFKSPAFNGVGYSSHVLTIENQERVRQKAINDAETAAAARAQADARNTNLAKFLNNVETRILAQLSKQLTDQLFSDTGATSGTLTFEGTTMSYVKTATEVSLTIVDDAGSRTDITIPIGTFKF